MPTSSKVRCQADENPPSPLAFGLGLQDAVLVIARADEEAAELEFVAAGGGEYLEDRMALGDAIDVPPEQNVSRRLLRHFASAIRHQQYHDANIVTVRAERAPGLQGNPDLPQG